MVIVQRGKVIKRGIVLKITNASNDLGLDVLTIERCFENGITIIESRKIKGRIFPNLVSLSQRPMKYNCCDKNHD